MSPSHSAERAHWELSEVCFTLLNLIWTVSPLGYSAGEGQVCVLSPFLTVGHILFTSLLTKLAVGPQTHPQGLSFVRVAETVVKGSKCEIPFEVACVFSFPPQLPWNSHSLLL